MAHRDDALASMMARVSLAQAARRVENTAQWLDMIADQKEELDALKSKHDADIRQAQANGVGLGSYLLENKLAQIRREYESQRRRLTGKHKRAQMIERGIFDVDEYVGNMTALEILQDQIKMLLPGRAIPTTVDGCTECLKGIHVHIFDYVRGQYRVLKDVDELRERCGAIGTYPRESAKSEGLRHFLKHLSGGNKTVPRHRSTYYQ